MANQEFVTDKLKELKTERSIVSEMEFQASQVIERLEEAAERAAEGLKTSPSGQAWKSIYSNLSLPSKSSSEILRVLEDLMTYEDSSNFSEWAEEGSQQPPVPAVASFPTLDSVSKLAIVSQSLTALASTLDRTHCQQINTRLINDCTRWLGQLFRFSGTSSFFHEDPLEGIVQIARYVLYSKYPKYFEDGFEALVSEPPVIYSSIASPVGIVQHLCRQIGLPLHCVQPVPCNTLFGSQQKMDIVELERLIEKDKLNKRVPLLVLADAGTIIAGHVDNLKRIQEVCEKHNVWLHLRGYCLAALCLASPCVSASKPQKLADSVTLPIGTWLGVPSLPVVTLYYVYQSEEGKSEGSGKVRSVPVISGLLNEMSSHRITCFSLWTTLQADFTDSHRGGEMYPSDANLVEAPKACETSAPHSQNRAALNKLCQQCTKRYAGFGALGKDGIQNRISKAFESSEIMWKAIANFPSLHLLSQQPGGEGGSYTIADVLGKQINPMLLLEVVACTVVFQFISGADSNSGRAPPYYDKLNTWLGHILQQECPQVVIDLCEMESRGIVLRYCPLELSPDNLPSQDELNQFISCLEQQLEVLTATVQLKEVFQHLVSQNTNLELVQDMADWAGLGGVRYIPDGWAHLDGSEHQDELNRLNVQLVDRLQSTDQAFSLGEETNGMAYVRFGMVTAGSDVEELLELVLSVGKEVEESSRFLETMSQVVKKGIEAATLDLQKENEERLWQEGILRQVPVVGSLVNWWSPRSKEGGIKGRSLNLNAGIVESTENIYRYHMQLQESTGASGVQGTRVTPTPMVQTPVGGLPGSQHSRSSSQASQISQTGSSQVPVSNLSVSSLHINANSVPTHASLNTAPTPELLPPSSVASDLNTPESEISVLNRLPTAVQDEVPSPSPLHTLPTV